jgi:hypothetical protein
MKTKRPRSASAAKQLAAMNARIQDLNGNIRGMLIDHIVDLEIASGTKRENDRAEMILTLSDRRKYPKESLEELRRVLIGVLHSRTAKESPPEPVPEHAPPYIEMA